MRPNKLIIQFFCQEILIVFGCLLADKVMVGTYNFKSFIVKIILLELSLVLSSPAATETQYFVHLSFHSALQLSIAFQVISKNYLEILMAQHLLHFLEFYQRDSQGFEELCLPII